MLKRLAKCVSLGLRGVNQVLFQIYMWAKAINIRLKLRRYVLHTLLAISLSGHSLNIVSFLCFKLSKGWYHRRNSGHRRICLTLIGAPALYGYDWGTLSQYFCCTLNLTLHVARWGEYNDGGVLLFKLRRRLEISITRYRRMILCSKWRRLTGRYIIKYIYDNIST